MPSSRSMSRRLPRDRRKLSSSTSCSFVRRPKRPTLNSPSSVVPQERQWSLVTASSPEQTGQVEITSCGMRILSCVSRLSHTDFHFVKVRFLYYYFVCHTGSLWARFRLAFQGRRAPRPPLLSQMTAWGTQDRESGLLGAQRSP